MTADLATITGIEVPTALLIGGQWTGGRAGVLPVVDPATEDAVAEVASASTDDALDAVTAAHDALPGWCWTMIRFAPDGATTSEPSFRTASSAYQRKNSAA